jgi:outer membrane protein OmpA-like peptidoglycan-associated protein
MLLKRLYALLTTLLLLFTCGTVFAEDRGVLEVRSARAGATVEVERVIKEGQVLVSATDAARNPLMGLTAQDLGVSRGGIPAKIISVKPITESQEVTRHLVLMLDNSFSMYERNAIKALLAGLDRVLKIVRPIDRVHLVIFDNKPSTSIGGRQLSVNSFSSSDPNALREFARKAYSQQGLTGSTVLYEGMVAGLDIIAKSPATDPRIMVVFSDGEDLNSELKEGDVQKAAQGIERFNAYAIDYMPGYSTNKFLSSFASQHNGQIWKATAEDNLVTIFESVASQLQHYYVVTYDFVPTGAIAVATNALNIEEIKTIDASPLLGHVYFDKGSAEIPDRYVRFRDANETKDFDDQKFRDTNEKYRQLLNIIGKRLADKPEATITLVGCNDNSGVEKGKTKLSTQRAEEVKAYLQTVWNIAPERMKVEARNLPQMASTSSSKEGQAENRRVEILSPDMTIVAPVRSVYVSTNVDHPELLVTPTLSSSYGVSTWKVSASNASGVIAEKSGFGALAEKISLPLEEKDLPAIGSGGDITVRLEMKDIKGQPLVVSSEPLKVSFSQVSQRKAKKQGQKVVEKYALILFDFNKDTISGLNREIVNRIVGRFKTLPQATLTIVGHTDNIGSESYNMKLSQRRAAAVNKLLTSAYGEPGGDRIRFSGVGQDSPLYDNQTPEGRAFNRTVTITMEYLSDEQAE